MYYGLRIHDIGASHNPNPSPLTQNQQHVSICRLCM